MIQKYIEITSPVGSYESLSAAIQAGAGSVYFGVGNLNMRSKSTQNFSIEDLKKITSTCHKHNIRTYLTLNSVIYDGDMSQAEEVIDAACKNNIDALIVSDLAVIMLAQKAGMPVHMSTQSNISNIEAVKFFAQFADVMVLARELNLSQVAAITKAIEDGNITGPSGNPVRIEIFAHGALCMAVSGKCYLSLDNYNHSANRGACLQLCRRPYKVTDLDGSFELAVDNEYIMSPKDLKTIDFLDKIIKAGVSILKIEGRGRSADYVKTVTRVYREAVDSVLNNTWNGDKLNTWNVQLKTVYNRGFWDGYYLGRKMGEWTDKYGSSATRQKLYVGKITNYFSKLNVAEIKIETNDLNIGDEINIIGPTTGVYEDLVKELRDENTAVVTQVSKGTICSIPVASAVRRNDKVYRIIKTED